MTAAAQAVDMNEGRNEGRAITRNTYQLQPLRAWRALRRLIADKEDTTQVFELIAALSGNSITKGYARLIGTEQGGRIAYEHDEFAARLSDKAWLASFGPGTVGAAYRDFVAPRGLTAEGLADESRAVNGSNIDAQHPLAWYGRRLRDIHDVWHVLTGYGTDAVGEACLVAFSFEQTRSLGFRVIAYAAGNETRKLGSDQPYWAAIREGFRNGKNAAWLPAVDYPSLFAESLDKARERLNIAQPVIYQSIPSDLREPPLAA
jgi:ubiquinone biosynthesis protein COQ4